MRDEAMIHDAPHNSIYQAICDDGAPGFPQMVFLGGGLPHDTPRNHFGTFAITLSSPCFLPSLSSAIYRLVHSSRYEICSGWHDACRERMIGVRTKCSASFKCRSTLTNITGIACNLSCIHATLFDQADRSSEGNGTAGLPPHEGTTDDCSILKYEDPVLARPDVSYDMALGHDSLPQYVSLYATNERGPIETTLHHSAVGAAAVRSVRSRTRPPGGGGDITAVIKAMIPNKEFSNEAGEWVQTVSKYSVC